MGSPYTCMASQLTTSPPSASASSTASLDSPAPVCPMTHTTGGGGSVGESPGSPPRLPRPRPSRVGSFSRTRTPPAACCRAQASSPPRSVSRRSSCPKSARSANAPPPRTAQQRARGVPAGSFRASERGARSANRLGGGRDGMCENSASATAAAKPPARAPPETKRCPRTRTRRRATARASRWRARDPRGWRASRSHDRARRSEARRGPRRARVRPRGPPRRRLPSSSSSPLATAARLTAAAASVAATTAAVAGVNLPILRHISPEDEEGYVPFVVHGGGALTSELLARCPTPLPTVQAPAMVHQRARTDPHRLRAHAHPLPQVRPSARPHRRRWTGGPRLAGSRAIRSTSARPRSRCRSPRTTSAPPPPDEGVAASSIPDASTLSHPTPPCSSCCTALTEGRTRDPRNGPSPRAPREDGVASR